MAALAVLSAILVLAPSCATSSGDEPDREPDPVVSRGRTWPELAETPRLPIGMNLSELSYYSPFLLFTDAMKTSGEMMSVHAGILPGCVFWSTIIISAATGFCSTEPGRSERRPGNSMEDGA
jgi:hypothetical protein